MSFWSAAVIIVAIWGFVQIYTRRHDRELGVTRDHMGNPVFQPPQEGAPADQEIAELRERIKVLERIATEGNTIEARETRRIAEEIESLRDQQGQHGN